MKKLTAIILCVLILLSCSFAEEDSSADSGIPTFGLKSGMSFDEVKKIMTDQGFTCIDETFGIDEIGAVSFSMDFTGDVKVFDIPVYSIQVFMENDGDALHIYFSFHSYSYETDDGNTVVYRTLLTVYEDIRKAMRNHYGEPNYLHNTWRDGLKYYELDEPLNMPGQPAKIFQLELESFERPDDSAEP